MWIMLGVVCLFRAATAAEFICDGTDACAGIKFECGTDECLIECTGETSCSDVTLQCEQSPSCGIRCMSKHSCKGLVVVGRGERDPCSIHVVCNEDEACTDAVLSDVDSLVCKTGRESCRNATLPAGPLCANPFRECNHPLPADLLTPFTTCYNDTWSVMEDLTAGDLEIPQGLTVVRVLGKVSIASSLTLDSEDVFDVGGCFELAGELSVGGIDLIPQEHGEPIVFSLGTFRGGETCSTPALSGASFRTSNLCLDLVERDDTGGHCPSADVRYDGRDVVVSIRNPEKKCKATSCVVSKDDDDHDSWSRSSRAILMIVLGACVCSCVTTVFLCILCWSASFIFCGTSSAFAFRTKRSVLQPKRKNYGNYGEIGDEKSGPEERSSTSWREYFEIWKDGRRYTSDDEGAKREVSLRRLNVNEEEDRTFDRWKDDAMTDEDIEVESDVSETDSVKTV